MAEGKQTLAEVQGAEETLAPHTVFQHCAMFFVQFRNFWRNNQLAVWLFRIAFEVVLMVRFCSIEGFEGFDLRHEGGIPNFRGVEFRDDLFSGFFLCESMVQDYRSVLGAYV